MRTVRDACQLQPNALSIKLSDQIEQLDELINAEGDGTAFFEKTKITHGMQDLISEGVARLAGASSQAVFHLKQAMGGGKTHLLVGFGLLAKHPDLRKTYCGGTLYASAFECARVAAFNGRNNPDHFFWGEIASQLGKAEQFKAFWNTGPKAPDEKDWLNLLDGGEPILILFDEMPPYFHYYDTQKVGNGTVADIATRAFANLLTAAGKKSNVCVVVSDLAATYDTGTRLINRALEDARQELGRQERNITPVDLASNEIYDILRKRLFKSLPDTAEIADIAACYGKKLEEASKAKVANRGAEAIADEVAATYTIEIRTGVSLEELAYAVNGTVGRDDKYGEAHLVHSIGDTTYKTKMSTLRGDVQQPDGTIANRLRQWELSEFRSRPDDLLQERLYCVQWMRPKRKGKGKGFEYEFRSVTPADLDREQVVETFVAENLADWQARGWVPDMRIEVGGPPRYQGQDLIRARGWTHWHHLWNPRQLMSLAMMRKHLNDSALAVVFAGILDYSSKLSRWTTSPARKSKDGLDKQIGGASNGTANVFYNQALNTLYNYGSRATADLFDVLHKRIKHYPLCCKTDVQCVNAADFDVPNDIFVTDPPYGDAVKYEEILDFFIAWLRKNPPSSFAEWVWDSRRPLAIKGEDEEFRHNMVAAYKCLCACQPDNGIQVIMFTHQSGAIWADMANIVWASGLQATAAWYVATETDNSLREGSHVKGTVLLVCRKRAGCLKTTRDDLGWELQEEVESQVQSLTGLNQQAKGRYRDENVFEDADIQMAGYAAALRVLTRYAVIDGRDMAVEAIRPRVKRETTFVDDLIAFAVDTANRCLVPQGIAKGHWDSLVGAERFYLKMIDLESRGAKTLDNYQNFAKAFKVRDFRLLMASEKANHSRLKSAVEFGKSEMSEGSELYQSVLRSTLYALMELVQDTDGSHVLAHLTLNIKDYYSVQNRRELVAGLADYLAKKLETLRPNEASAARVLRELVRNQRLG